MKINVEESKRVGQHVNAQDKDCFFNSVMGLAYLDEPTSVYVEGFCVAHDMPIIAQHGWIEREGGEIIDPTPVYHSDRTEREYFPVDRYTMAEFRKLMFRKKTINLPLTDPWEIKEEWRAAYEKAEEFLYPPETLQWIRDMRSGKIKMPKMQK